MCNQDCSFCAYRMSGYTSNELFVGDSELAKIGHNNPKRWIETGRAMDLIEEINELGCLSVQFTGGGEPTVHPDHKQIFVHALDSGLRCSLVSNGLRWDYDLIHTILPWFDWVRVSIDAATPDSYAKTRRVPKGHWNRVWTNVNVLARSLKNHKSRCAFGLGFVVTPDSYKEIVDFARLAKVSGVGNIRYTAMFSTENETPFIP
ncbi:MAG: radical SAM protein, partial [Planctomycetota bacterium]